MSIEEGDQGQDELVAPGTDTEQVQPESGAEQAAEGTVADASIVVGNQKFKDLEALKAGYSELQKGFTKKTQEYSGKLKAYEGFAQWVGDLKKDPAAWNRFVSYIRGGATQQQAAKAVQAEQTSEEPEEQDDPRFAQLERQHEETAAAVEYLDFRSVHSDMDQETLKKVITMAADKADEGENWSLEMCYRWLAAEGGAQAKMVAAGQEQVQQSLAKGQKATALGTSPSAPQAQAKARLAQKGAKSFGSMNPREQGEAIERKLRDLGARFEDEG